MLRYGPGASFPQLTGASLRVPPGALGSPSHPEPWRWGRVGHSPLQFPLFPALCFGPWAVITVRSPGLDFRGVSLPRRPLALEGKAAWCPFLPTSVLHSISKPRSAAKCNKPSIIQKLTVSLLDVLCNFLEPWLPLQDLSRQHSVPRPPPCPCQELTGARNCSLIPFAS